MVMASPAKTFTAIPVSVSLAVLATEGSWALLVAPLVLTVTASLTMALTQVLRRVSVPPMRVFVSVQTILSSPAVTARTLPASGVALPEQASDEV